VRRQAEQIIQEQITDAFVASQWIANDQRAPFVLRVLAGQGQPTISQRLHALLPD
jgi:hypothetical protein